MIELVWDAHRCGTATAPSGRSVTVGEGANFSPDDLLAIAAAGCLMRKFLRLTDEADATILGFTATASVDSPDAPGTPRVRVQAYVLASRKTRREDLEKIFTAAARLSPIARLLGDHLALRSDIKVLASAHAEA
jgi:organic hydroperoxide reductase OsmC/OhrA